MLNGVENKDTEQREFKALVNTKVLDKVWQEESLTKNHTCFKHCFHWYALTYLGRPSCQMHPALHASMCIWAYAHTE